MKHAGSSYFSFVVCFIVPFIVKCSTANKNIELKARKKEPENYSVSSPHKHSFKKGQSKTRGDVGLLQEGLIVGG